MECIDGVGYALTHAVNVGIVYDDKGVVVWAIEDDTVA